MHIQYFVETLEKEKLFQIINYDLLPVLYSDLWNEKEKKWLVDEDAQPTLLDGVKKIEALFSTSVDQKTGLLRRAPAWSE